VLYTPGQYYADDWLQRQFPWWMRLLHLRPIAGARLLFRLANRWQASTLFAPHAYPYELTYLASGGKKGSLVERMPDETVGFLYLKHAEEGALEHLGQDSLLVVGELQKNKELWKQVLQDSRTRVTFDLYDYGIAVFDPMLQRQDYIVNW